jgi:hypothetical protein
MEAFASVRKPRTRHAVVAMALLDLGLLYAELVLVN